MHNDHKEYVLSNQILKSGTSIGANIREALASQSKHEFISKMYISLKEANETEYWLKLLIESDMIDKNTGLKLINELEQIINILNSIIKTSKKNTAK
jgi:four helix bundle protein